VYLWSYNEEDEGDDEHDLELVPSFAYEKLSSSSLCISKNDKQKVLILESVLFYLKHKA